LLPAKPLKPQALKLFDRIKPKIQKELVNLTEIPVSVLLWGPSPDSIDELGQLRLDLRDELRENGHLALFSEEIVDTSLPTSIRIQQLIHAQEFDIIVSMPSTAGSIGELHDFAGDRRINSKLVVCLNEEYLGGYSNQSIQAFCTALTLEAIYYKGISELPIIKQAVLNHIQRIREVKYFYGGRI